MKFLGIRHGLTTVLARTAKHVLRKQKFVCCTPVDEVNMPPSWLRDCFSQISLICSQEAEVCLCCTPLDEVNRPLSSLSICFGRTVTMDARLPCLGRRVNVSSYKRPNSADGLFRPPEVLRAFTTFIAMVCKGMGFQEVKILTNGL